MPNLNKVFLMGHLTRDVDLRFTPTGHAVANIGFAVNNSRKNEAGEWENEPVFIDVTVWGDRAEKCNETLAKGSPLFIEGRLQFRQWETDDGQKRSKLEVVADRVQFLHGKSSGGVSDSDDIPF